MEKENDPLLNLIAAAIVLLDVFLLPILFLFSAQHSLEKRTQRNLEFSESIDREQEIGKLPAEHKRGCGQSDYFLTGRGSIETRLAYSRATKELGWISDYITQVVVVIDDSKQTPTTKTFRQGSTERYVIRISRADYDKAPCLQEARRGAR